MTIADELQSIRKYLHQHPELSGNEYRTAKKIVEFVSQYNPTTVIENLGETGVLALFDFGNNGPTIMFRAELDALPIQEVNEFEHRSTTKNVSHKCGHDGHSTILIGLAKLLSEKPLNKGRIALLFQPAEETGDGAKAVLNDPGFEAVRPDYVFALHNLPGYPLHQIVVRDGSFTAAVKSITIKLSGKTAHAAEPEHGINPALAISTLVEKCLELSNNNLEDSDFSVVTPVHIEMGSIDFGISAGYGEVRFTIRTWTEDRLDTLTEKIKAVINSTTKEHQLKAIIEISHHFRANQNDTEAVNTIRQSAIKNKLSLTERPFPFKWGEDFGLFTQKYKGAMFGLGSGENTPALHNPDYDFPDEITSTGVNTMYEIASKIMA